MSHPDTGHRPLVLFTSLAVAGAGAIVSGAAGLYAADASRLALIAGAVLLAAGLVVSVGHLGRRERAPYAARGLAHSPISREAVLGGLTVVLALLALALPGIASSQWMRWGAGVLAVGFLISVGLVYRIGGQLTWTGASALTPLTAGLAFGAVFADSLPPSHAVSTVTVGALALDTLVFSRRWRQVLQVAVDHPGTLGTGFDRRHEWLAGRFFLLDVVPCVLLFLWPTPLTAACAGVGVIADRAGFYALAFQHRTEAEIGRVERLMDGR